MRENVKNAIGTQSVVDVEAVWSVLKYINTTNLAWAIYSEREDWHPVILESRENLEFVTGDQPVINMAAVGLELHEEPSGLELYYPISPRKALLITSEPKGFGGARRSISEREVEFYNRAIIDQSGKQVYGRTEALLGRYAD